jgi:hypothetical protein
MRIALFWSWWSRDISICTAIYLQRFLCWQPLCQARPIKTRTENQAKIGIWTSAGKEFRLPWRKIDGCAKLFVGIFLTAL